MDANDEAARLLLQALAINERAFRKDHTKVVDCMHLLATVHFRSRRARRGDPPAHPRHRHLRPGRQRPPHDGHWPRRAGPDPLHPRAIRRGASPLHPRARHHRGLTLPRPPERRPRAQRPRRDPPGPSDAAPRPSRCSGARPGDPRRQQRAERGTRRVALRPRPRPRPAQAQQAHELAEQALQSLRRGGRLRREQAEVSAWLAAL